MVKAVASELQERIEQIRRQAFAAGYAEAMKAVRQLASRPARNSGNGAAEPNRRGDAVSEDAQPPRRRMALAECGPPTPRRRLAVLPVPLGHSAALTRSGWRRS